MKRQITDTKAVGVAKSAASRTRFISIQSSVSVDRMSMIFLEGLASLQILTRKNLGATRHASRTSAFGRFQSVTAGRNGQEQTLSLSACCSGVVRGRINNGRPNDSPRLRRNRPLRPSQNHQGRQQLCR